MKITSKQSKAIQNSNESVTALAKKYGVTTSTIYNHKKKKQKEKKEVYTGHRVYNLTEDALQMIYEKAEGKEENVEQATADVLNWAAAAQQAGATLLIDKKKKKPSFAQKIKAKLKF